MLRSDPPVSVRRTEARVLVLVAGQRELEVTLELLAGERILGVACRDARELVERMREGASAALIAEEVLDATATELLTSSLAEQPPWSDFPLILFGVPERESRRYAFAQGNVSFLDRPVRVRSMLAAVHAALRSRARQYDARHAIESRDAFLAMLGHELRNPLSAISLAGTLLSRRLADADAGKELAIISRQSAHLTRLVDDLLDVARITYGKVSLARQPVLLAEVARASFETLQHRAQDHLEAYELEVVAPAACVEGDRQRLEQVISNLLTNAIKYTPRGGRVKLSVRSEEGSGVVEVADSGVGLAPAMLPRVFEPFAQADSSLDRSQGGIGLGLALVHNIVQMHGGSVEARSAGLGRGSSFIVRLPLRSLPLAERDGGDSAAGVAPPQRVVVVDDNSDIRDLLARLLADAGHTVFTAADGPSGLECVLSSAPDIALVDIGLPGFDGLELARRARVAGVRCRLVALTGYGRSEDKSHAQLAGFDRHLVKPVSEAELRELFTSPSPAPLSA